MKKFFKTLWIIVCVPLTSIYILCSLSSFIPPSGFSCISLFSIAWPYVFAVFIVALLISFFAERRLAYIMLAISAIGYFNFTTTFALRTPSAWVEHKDSSTLRIMTWNVQNFANYLRRKKAVPAFKTTREAMLGTIQKYNPDVLCFQEYKNTENAKHQPSVRRQLDSLGYKYYFCSEDRVSHHLKNYNVRSEEGVAIYSRQPFTETGKKLINPDKNAHLIYVGFLLNNQPVRIYTAHLESFAIYKDTAKYEDDNIYKITYKKRKAAQYRIRETELKHQAEVTQIRSSIYSSPHAVVYCGDLNATPASYNYRRLKDDDLQDAFLQKGSGIGNTFYKIGPTLRIDVILADKTMQVQQCIREKKKLSDHYPVIADLSWKQP